MPSAVIQASALRVVLDLPSGTELSDRDLCHLIDERVPDAAACDDLEATREAASLLAQLGYLMVARDEPCLYRVP